MMTHNQPGIDARKKTSKRTPRPPREPARDSVRDPVRDETTTREPRTDGGAADGTRLDGRGDDTGTTSTTVSSSGFSSQSASVTDTSRVRGSKGEWVVLYDHGPYINQKGGGSSGADLSVRESIQGVPNDWGYQLNDGWRLFEQLNVTGCGWYISHIDFYAFVGDSATSTTSPIDAYYLEVSLAMCLMSQKRWIFVIDM